MPPKLSPWQCFTSAFGKRTRWTGRVDRRRYNWFLLFWFICLIGCSWLFEALFLLVLYCNLSYAALEDCCTILAFTASGVGLVFLYYLFKMAEARAHDRGWSGKSGSFLGCTITVTIIEVIKGKDILLPLALCGIFLIFYTFLILPFARSQRHLNQWGKRTTVRDGWEDDTKEWARYDETNSGRYWTVRLLGKHKKRKLDLEELTERPLIFGRGSNSNRHYLGLGDKRAALLHFVLGERKGHPILCDLGSRRGTYVNNKLIPAQTDIILRSGDVVTAGDTQLEFLLG